MCELFSYSLLKKIEILFLHFSKDYKLHNREYISNYHLILRVQEINLGFYLATTFIFHILKEILEQIIFAFEILIFNKPFLQIIHLKIVKNKIKYTFCSYVFIL